MLPSICDVRVEPKGTSWLNLVDQYSMQEVVLARHLFEENYKFHVTMDTIIHFLSRK